MMQKAGKGRLFCPGQASSQALLQMDLKKNNFGQKKKSKVSSSFFLAEAELNGVPGFEQQIGNPDTHTNEKVLLQSKPSTLESQRWALQHHILEASRFLPVIKRHPWWSKKYLPRELSSPCLQLPCYRSQKKKTGRPQDRVRCTGGLRAGLPCREMVSTLLHRDPLKHLSQSCHPVWSLQG